MRDVVVAASGDCMGRLIAHEEGLLRPKNAPIPRRREVQSRIGDRPRVANSGKPRYKAPQTQKSPASSAGLSLFDFIAGDHLISHTVSRAVPSAQRGLTSVFGMGTGDPSQYGHRQIEAFRGRPSPQPKS
jgi:hypothetical protein